MLSGREALEAALLAGTSAHVASKLLVAESGSEGDATLGLGLVRQHLPFPNIPLVPSAFH